VLTPLYPALYGMGLGCAPHHWCRKSFFTKLWATALVLVNMDFIMDSTRSPMRTILTGVIYIGALLLSSIANIIADRKSDIALQLKEYNEFRAAMYTPEQYVDLWSALDSLTNKGVTK